MRVERFETEPFLRLEERAGRDMDQDERVPNAIMSEAIVVKSIRIVRIHGEIWVQEVLTRARDAENRLRVADTRNRREHRLHGGPPIWVSRDESLAEHEVLPGGRHRPRPMTAGAVTCGTYRQTGKNTLRH